MEEEDLDEEEDDLEEEEDLVEEEVLWEEEELLLAWAQPSPEEAAMAIARVDARIMLKMFFMMLCFSSH